MADLLFDKTTATVLSSSRASGASFVAPKENPNMSKFETGLAKANGLDFSYREMEMVPFATGFQGFHQSIGL